MRPILFDINDAARGAGADRSPGGPPAGEAARLAAADQRDHRHRRGGAHLRTAEGPTRSAINVLIALFVSFTISFELVVLLSRSILRPIEDLEAATQRIRQGRFDEHVPVTTSDEFGELSSAFNQMVDGLAERERLREAFGTYLDEEVAEHLISEDFEPAGRGGRGLAGLLRRARLHHRGRRGRCAGDRRAPQRAVRVHRPDRRPPPRPHRPVHRRRPCSPSSARPSGSPTTPTGRCSARSSWRGRSTAAGPGGFQVGVGVNSGSVVAGAIGGAGRLSFSVIGDAVNLCSRVEADDPRDRRLRADHGGDARAALRDDRGRVARGARDPRLRPPGGAVRAAGAVRAHHRTGVGRQRPAGRPRRSAVSAARRSRATASVAAPPGPGWGGPVPARTADSARPTRCRAPNHDLRSQWAAAHPGGGGPRTPYSLGDPPGRY